MDHFPSVLARQCRAALSAGLILAFSSNAALILVPSSSRRQTAMLIYEDLVELARMCARNARITTSRDVADELWRMAKDRPRW